MKSLLTKLIFIILIYNNKESQIDDKIIIIYKNIKHKYF